MTNQTASALGYKYLFGPVFSRRLGRSLGVDLLPYKTCSLDCVYCECGATTTLTAVPSGFVSMDHVVAELDDYLARQPDLDFVTFAGSSRHCTPALAPSSRTSRGSTPATRSPCSPTARSFLALTFARRS